MARLARLPPAQTGEVTVERDLPVAMADGVTLLADRWAPEDGASPVPPIVLLRSPYGRRQIGIVGRLFAERGFQVVIQSCRGTFGSGGTFDPFRHEEADGRDTLAWLATRPWFGGEVCLFGPSYLGLTQWAAIGDAPGFVVAMAPAVTATNFRDAVIYPGGSLALESLLSWVHQVEHQEDGGARVAWAMARAQARLAPGYGVLPLSEADRRVVGRRVGFYQDWLTHDAPKDPWWDPVDFRSHRAGAPPAALVAGWYDLFLPAQVEDFVALRSAGREARLTVGPWTHAQPAGMAASVRDALDWFAAHRALPGAAAGGGAGPSEAGGGAVRLFVMGTGRWVDLDDWPPPATVERWHLHARGLLDPATPVTSDPDTFRFDPADPTPGVGGPSLDARNAGRKDQRRRETRADVLTYTSVPLPEDTTVAGPLRVDLHLRSSRDHSDVFVRLCVVTARGRSFNVSDGIARVGPGDVMRSTDGSFRVLVDMWPTAMTFRRGERIRLQVSGGAHPLFARNPGSGEPLGEARRLEVAEQEVLHDPDHPSAIELPRSPI
jgi:putative CocE/NonD family hydrolase